MALFRSKNAGLQDLLRKVKEHAYATNAELDEMLAQIAQQKELRPRMLLFMLADTSPKIREWGSRMLPQLAGANLTGLIIDAMQTLPDARRELAKELAKVPVQRIYEAVGPMVHAKDKTERAVALTVIAHHEKWPEFLGFLKTALRDPEGEIRRAAVRILRRAVRNPTIRLILIELIHDADPQVRREVIATLASDPSPDIVEPFFSRLPEEPPETQRFMVDALAKLAASPQARLEERLLPMLAHEDCSLRDVAVQILASMPRRAQVLRSFLIHARGLATWLRERTTKSILAMSQNVVDPLIELMQDPEDDIRVGAMVMAADSNDPRIVPYVKAIFLSDCDWWMRALAADVLARFPTQDVVETLLSRIDDRDLRYGVISVLGRMLGPRTVPVLLHSLRDPSRGIRTLALDALRGVPGEQIARAVASVVVNDPEHQVREKARDVLRSFGSLGVPYFQEIEKIEARREQEAAGAKLALQLEMVNKELNR